MSVTVIDTIKPKNNGTFPIVNAEDVAITSLQRLPEALDSKANVSALNATNSQLDTKANVTDVNTSINNLQAQIDELVTPVTQDAEVENARVDVNGVTHTTLKERIDSDVNSVKKDLDAVEHSLELFKNYDEAEFRNGYYDETGTFNSDANWKTDNEFTSILPNTKYKYFGNLVGTTGGLALFDADGEIVQLIANTVTEQEFVSAPTAIYAYYTYYSSGDDSSYKLELWRQSDTILEINNKIEDVEEGYNLFKEFNTTVDTFANGYYNASGEFVSNEAWHTCSAKTYISGNRYYKYVGNLLGHVAGMAVYDSNDNMIDFITAESTATEEKEVEFFTAANASYLYYTYRDSLNVTNPKLAIYEDIPYNKQKYNKKYDVCIIGSGIGGISACYGLLNSGLKIALVEKDARIGGTHVNGWVNCMAEGFSPKFMDNILETMLATGSAKYVNGGYHPFEDPSDLVYKDSWTRDSLRTDGSYKYANILFDEEALREKYIADLSGAVDIYTNAKVTSCKTNNGTIKSITFNDTVISAKLFIDATGDDWLLQLAGGSVVYGEDSKTRYQVSHGFTEPSAPDSNNNKMNPPTLYYRIRQGEENLDDVEVSFSAGGDTYENTYETRKLINNSQYMGITGYNVIERGEDYIYNWLSQHLIQQWKKLITVYPERYAGYRYEQCAYKVGIREGYRAICERMLSENDLYVRISDAAFEAQNSLDLPIAVGAHGYDVHYDSTIDSSYINSRVVPYTVKYGSIIPVGFKNLYIASRGAGFTHIGAASFRLIKDISSIGYFAGMAAIDYVNNERSDVRNVNVASLYSRDKTDFKTRFDELLLICG